MSFGKMFPTESLLSKLAHRSIFRQHVQPSNRIATDVAVASTSELALTKLWVWIVCLRRLEPSRLQLKALMNFNDFRRQSDLLSCYCRSASGPFCPAKRPEVRACILVSGLCVLVLFALVTIFFWFSQRATGTLAVKLLKRADCCREFYEGIRQCDETWASGFSWETTKDCKRHSRGVVPCLCQVWKWNTSHSRSCHYSLLSRVQTLIWPDATVTGGYSWRLFIFKL